jgi:hypothetical protein
MRHVLGQGLALQAQGDGRKFISGFFGEGGARQGRLEFLGIEEKSLEPTKLFGLAEILKLDFICLGHRVRPGGADEDTIRIAGDL